MHRYIDARPYEDCRIILNREDTGVPVRDIPTADVAPKSEVARLTIDMNAARLGMIAEQERLKTARSDVAREIFEEIESLLYKYTYQDVHKDFVISIGVTYELDELKKKYTEEQK